jgi:hypothetical protein|tara:strand:+ start:132 stop:428 length:297 start_codon:yes stop_codon:yes gene_type:complete
MAFKLKYKNLQGVVDQLRGAVKAHGKQADIIEKHIGEMEEGSPNKMTSPMKNYKNPQDYKVFNMGNEPTPFEKGRCWKGYKPNPDGRPASEQGSCVKA